MYDSECFPTGTDSMCDRNTLLQSHYANTHDLRPWPTSTASLPSPHCAVVSIPSVETVAPGLSKMPGKSDSTGMCAKCSSERVVVWMQSGARCRICFLSFMQRSFKVSLGRTGFGGRNPGKLAILVSGGPCSAAAAYLYANYLTGLAPNPRAETQQPILVHIRQCPASVSAVENLSAELGLKLYVADIDLVPIKNALDSDIVQRKRVLAAALRAAEHLHASKVLVASSADRVAVDVISHVFSGCGPAVAEAAQEVYSRGSITAQRPFLHIPTRLVVRFAYFVFPGFSFYSGNAGVSQTSLRQVIERFVEGAQDDNHASIHNVVRTAMKLSSTDDACSPCSLCGEACTPQIYQSHVFEDSEKRNESPSSDAASSSKGSKHRPAAETGSSSEGEFSKDESIHVRADQSCEGDNPRLCHHCKACVTRAGDARSEVGQLILERATQGPQYVSVKEYLRDYLLESGDD